MNSLPDYRQQIALELEKRLRKNSNYSLRAFARDLSISPSRLSEILKHKNGLSLKNAAVISDALKLNDFEKEYFITSVRSQHSRSLREKKQALEKLNLLQNKIPQKKINTDEFKLITDWAHLAVLELFNIKNFRLNIKTVTEKLNLTKDVSIDAVKRLKKLGWIRNINGEWKTDEAFRTFSSAVPSSAIRQYHKNIIQSAIKSIDEQTIDERNLQSLVLSISNNKRAEAHLELEKFCIDFNQKFSAPKNQGDKIYALTLQFFRLGSK